MVCCIAEIPAINVALISTDEGNDSRVRRERHTVFIDEESGNHVSLFGWAGMCQANIGMSAAQGAANNKVLTEDGALNCVPKVIPRSPLTFFQSLNTYQN
jgi:hypothetical protein